MSLYSNTAPVWGAAALLRNPLVIQGKEDRCMQRTVLQAPCPYVFFPDLKSDDKVLIFSGAKTQLGSLVGIPQATPEGVGVQSFVSKCRLVSPSVPLCQRLSHLFTAQFSFCSTLRLPGSAGSQRWLVIIGQRCAAPLVPPHHACPS